MDLDHYLDRVFDSFTKILESLWNLIQRKGVRMHELCVEAFLRHEGGGSVGSTPAFTPDAVNINVVAHQLGQIDWHRFPWEGSKADSTSSIYHIHGLVQGVGGP